jgi:hypothetical protein
MSGIFDLLSCLVTLMECAYATPVTPAEFHGGVGL